MPIIPSSHANAFHWDPERLPDHLKAVCMERVPYQDDHAIYRKRVRYYQALTALWSQASKDDRAVAAARVDSQRNRLANGAKMILLDERSADEIRAARHWCGYCEKWRQVAREPKV